MDLRKTEGDVRLLLSRAALLHNLRIVRAQLQPGTRICAMVKADGYGHGADFIADTLCNFSADGLPNPAVDQFGVATLDEAAAMDETLLPILVLRAVENVYVGRQRELLEHAVMRGWILTLTHPAAADDLARIAIAVKKRANVHVMIDTGMTRCGCAPSTVKELLDHIASHGSLKLVSVGTHFACADSPRDPFTLEQFARFNEATANLPAGVTRHVANSAATFHFPQTHLDMVRPGIALYGIDPTCQPNLNRALRPIARWTAPILSILEARKGAAVGYGRTWTAPRDTRIGLVPVGYADGYLRSWGNRSVVLLHGKWVPVVGRVSMDQITVDLGDVPHARLGDEVTILGDDPLSPASAYALADLGESIPYEVVVRIGKRAKRVVVD